MSPLSAQQNFQSLSLKDLLEARDLYHWHLSNKANVVGTAIGLYLIRRSDPWPNGRAAADESSLPHAKGIRTFDNSEVRPYSWPPVIFLVLNWLAPSEFAPGNLTPTLM